jgi:hypothetical protein
MRRVLLVLTLISFAFGLCVFGVREGSAGASLQGRPGANSIAAQRAVRFVPRSITSANRKLRYTIKARYPQAVGAQRDPRLIKLNQELRALITKDIGGFRDDFQAPEERMGAVGSYYDAEYWVSLSTPQLVSLTFGVSTYYEGAAHPNHHTIAFNYDLTTGRLLTLKDLFKPGSDYLQVISDYTIQALKEKLGEDADEEWIQRGAGANEENYKSWNVTKTGLVVTFDPYQVVYYAAGPQEITIPYSVLRNVIDPEGPLAKLVK